MKFSAKRAPPESFVDWLGKASDNWKPTYASLQRPEICDVRLALLAEQEFVCCYCGRALREDQSDSHIDHFRPQKTYNGGTHPDLTVSYTNFVASCGPPDRNRRPSTCGDAKGSKFDETAYIEPWDPACEQRFRYGSAGVIQASAADDTAALKMIEILKLDEPSLMQERSALVAEIEEDIAAGEITAANFVAEIQRLQTAKKGRRSSFSQVAARYLETEFG